MARPARARPGRAAARARRRRACRCSASASGMQLLFDSLERARRRRGPRAAAPARCAALRRRRAEAAAHRLERGRASAARLAADRRACPTRAPSTTCTRFAPVPGRPGGRARHGEYGEPFVSAVARGQRLRRAVPPREVLGRTGCALLAQLRARCATAGRAPRDPLPGDRHPRRQAPCAWCKGDFDAKTVYDADPLRRRARAGSRPARAACTSSTSTARETGEPRRTSSTCERIAAELGVPVQYGGGLRSLERDRAALGGGRRAGRSSARRRSPTSSSSSDALARARPERVVVSVDVRGGHGRDAGWTKTTSMPRREAHRAPAASAACGRSSTRTSTATGCSSGADLDEVERRRRRRCDGERSIYSGGIGDARPTSRRSRRCAPSAAGSLAGVIVGKALLRAALHGRRGASDGARRLSAQAARRRGYRGGVHFKRVIPCLDVDARARRQGHELRRHPRRRRPGRAGRALRRARAPTSSSSSTSRRRTSKRDTIVELARRTADDVFIPFTIGGGIRSVADAQAVLDAGADKVVGQLGGASRGRS